MKAGGLEGLLARGEGRRFGRLATMGIGDLLLWDWKEILEVYYHRFWKACWQKV